LVSVKKERRVLVAMMKQLTLCELAVNEPCFEALGTRGMAIDLAGR
jgi:hypothetical protein